MDGDREILLREMDGRDLDTVLCWRNAPDIRSKMFTTQKIAPSEHKKWYQIVRNAPDKCFFIAEENKRPIGFVSFTGIDRADSSAEWGFYKAPDAPKGTGFAMLVAALELAFNQLALDIIHSRVRVINPGVLHLHQKLGFTQDAVARYLPSDHNPSVHNPSVHNNTMPYFAFALTRQEWQQANRIYPKTKLTL